MRRDTAGRRSARAFALAALLAVAACGGGGGSERAATSTTGSSTTETASDGSSTTTSPDATTSSTTETSSPTGGGSSTQPSTTTTVAGTVPTTTVPAPSGKVTASNPQEVTWHNTNSCKPVGVTIHNGSTAAITSVTATFRLLVETTDGQYLFQRLLTSEKKALGLAPGASLPTTVSVCPLNADLPVLESNKQYRVDVDYAPTVAWTWSS